MANNDYSLPFQDLTNLVPANLRNPMVKSLMDNLFNRFLTQDEAVPLYGYIGRKPSSPDDRTPRVPQLDVERDVNALIPVLSFKTGTETHSFTAQDLIRKAEVLGISADQSQWLYSQGNNYAPPIDLDKFTNFFNYYWVATALPSAPSLAWNPTNAPEYYTIAAPKPADLDKLNVRVATTGPITMTGTGYVAQLFTVNFISATEFTVSTSDPLCPPAEVTQGPFSLPVLNADPAASVWPTSTFPVQFKRIGAAAPLLTFNVVRDIVLDGSGIPLAYEAFAAGDSFTITAPFLTSTYNVTFSGSPGVKGKLTAINSLGSYQTVDGVPLKANDRVLVRHGLASEQGIYVVAPGVWTRASDFDGATAAAGAKVFVTGGSQATSMFQSYTAPGGYSWSLLATGAVSNTNDWQEGNFWVKRDALVAAGVDLSKVVQATRPIIEYHAGLKLNTRVLNGVPTDVGGIQYEQRKTEFNQAPLYDLFRYDGTHTGRVSSLFFYVEDPTASIDLALQRRVKHAANASSDYVFAHGMLEDNNGLLFYKNNTGKLKTIWHPGYSAATVVDQEYSGVSDGALQVTVGDDPYSAQQIWVLTAVSPYAFEVVGSKVKTLPPPYNMITVGVPYSNGLFNATITAGSVPFAVGDVFRFRIGNFETTRYVYRDADDARYDLFGGPAADVEAVGAWQVPRMLYTNVAADNGDEIAEGTLYSHFRGMLVNQLETTAEDRAFGGSIKLWSEQQNLLAALLMQRDVTPISMIDMAQRQYEIGYNTIADIYCTKIVEYFSKVNVISSQADVSTLLDYILKLRANDNDVRTVLFDSTSPVIGFPATLPQLGFSPLVQPGVVFDNELGAEVMQHHDGHLSQLMVQNAAFRDRIFGPLLMVTRSDGNVTPAVGSYTATEPTAPYKGLMWLYPGAETEIRVFDVVSDETSAPAAAGLKVGDYWYNRGANQLARWNGSLWIAEPSISAAWVTIDLAALLNAVLLEVEQRLYVGISSEQRAYYSAVELQNAVNGPLGAQLKRELNTWAVSNGFDPTAPDYDSADAFTWNYSSSTAFAPTGGPVPARWFNALKAHQATFGPLVVPTARPNLEPWKLLGHATKPANWDSLYKAAVTPVDITSSFTQVPVHAAMCSTASLNTPLSGLPTVDGISLTSGQLVLLASEGAAQNNGLWVVGAGPWSRAAVPLTADTVFNVQGGLEFQGAQFMLLNTVAALNVDPVNITQVRLWTPGMWAAIQAARPSLKLSVDTNRDALLPPYVSSYLPWSVHALTNVMPPAPANAYVFGESSPVETVWMKSVEFRYSLARASFRYDPLAFLGNCWGFEWVEVDNILYDGYDMAVPGHPRFRLHGQPQDIITRTVPFTIGAAAGPVDFTIEIVRDAYTSTRAQSWSVTIGGALIGHLNEGVTSTISGLGYTLTNVRINDEGRPFRLGDKFTVSAAAAGTGMIVTFSPFSYHIVHGFGQTFTQALRAASIDTSQGYAINAYRNWDVNIGYRAGGLVSSDDLRVFTDAEPLPDSAYALRFKQSPYAKDLWAQGLRVTVVQMGAGTPTGAPGVVVPAGSASDWTFRIEGYNARHLELQYFSLDTQAEYSTFFALNQAHTILEWKNYTNRTGTVTAQLPLTVTGLQNVVTVLHGYASKLDADGWRFNDDGLQNIDADTGRVRNWQLEIEKLIDAVYTGVQLGGGHIVNPFIDRIWLEQDTGLMSKFVDTTLFDVSAHPAVFDILGTKLETNDLTVLRARGKSQLSAVVPMYSVHAQIDEYEHLFVFNNLSSPSTNSGLLYDPFSGARVATIKLNGRRQAARTLRPEFGGHYLVGSEAKKNLQATTDKIAGYYDADHVFEDELSTKHALALLGYSSKQYMTDLDLNDRTQFNFWRGLIQMKGTNASVSAFLNNDRFEDAKLDEYWAYKVAEYGDSRSKVFPELKLTVDDALQQFTKLIFDQSGANPPGFETFTNISADDEARWFSIDDLNGETSFEAQVVGTYTDAVTAGQVISLPFIADALVYDAAVFEQINGTTLRTIADSGAAQIIGYGPATPKFNPVKLFNYVNPELVEEIAHWHPAAGQHAPVAMESVNIISSKDPARYNVSTLVLGNANYDPLRVWGSKEVGRVWWDTTHLDYLPYADTTIFKTVDERLSRWGTLADYASVDVVEWVESAVPPNAYNAQAALDAGNADLDTRTRAEGTVYGAKTYVRDRVWHVRPIAWSEAGVATSRAHPAFNGAYFSNLMFMNNGLVALESGTFSQLGISAGMRIGAWQQDSTYTRPLNEFLVLDTFTKSILRNGVPIVPFSFTANGFTGTVTVSERSYTDKVGVLRFQAEQAVKATASGQPTGSYDVLTYLRVTEDASGDSDVVLVRNDLGVDPLGTSPVANATFTTFIGQTFTFVIFGLQLTVQSSVTGTFATDVLANFIEAALGNTITLMDAAQVERITPDPDSSLLPYPLSLSNDPNDPLNVMNNGIGWRAWQVPTQAELDADSRVPDCKWFPYVGPFVENISPSISTVQDGAGTSAFMLNDGTTINRYQTTWSDWTELKQITMRAVQATAPVAGVDQPVQFVVPSGTTAERVSVYVNGVAQLTGTYTLVGNVVTALKVPYGFHVVVIVRVYVPSTAELAFDPTIADNLLIQRQYKIDYQYVELPVRNQDGNITTTKYFFWVKNRTTAAPKNELSVKTVAQLLAAGPSQFLTFQNIQKPADTWLYNAIAINGLNYIVTKNSTFKLRFTRNFTLRDDPEQLDLKDTHAEWSLIRPGQRVKIPEALWRRLVNTACAADEAGNALPSPRRASYDSRNGTKTSFGFGPDQVLAPAELVISTLLSTILNTTLLDESGTVPMPDYMTFLDFSQVDSWFSTAANTRNTLTTIWNRAKVQQINELFFAVLEDIIAANYELTDLFKTSRLSAYSIKVVRPGPVSPTYE